MTTTQLQRSVNALWHCIDFCEGVGNFAAAKRHRLKREKLKKLLCRLRA